VTEDAPWCHTYLVPSDGWAESTAGAARAWARGNAFMGDRLLRAEALAQALLASAAVPEDPGERLSALLATLNGFFAGVIQGEGWVALCADRARSVPLFYAQRAGALWVSSDSGWVAANVPDAGLDEVSAAEFLLTGYTTGAHTLCPSVRQIGAGQWVLIRARETSPVATRTYAEWRHVRREDRGEDALLAEYDAALARVFQRLLQYAGGRQIVIPLSGGVDSRLEATMLRRAGYERVLCFSYGVPGNAESVLSGHVAASLGYPWVMIPYTRRQWASWYRSPQWSQYAASAGGLSTIPHPQDWPAVWELRQRALVDGDAVFIPGHIIPTGGRSVQIPAVYAEGPPDRDLLLENLWYMHYSLHFMRPRSARILAEVRLRLAESVGDVHSYVDTADASEAWEFRERQAKYITNSVRAYEYWGYDWWLPLLDADILAFWAGVPRPFRVRKILQRRAATRIYASLAGERVVPEEFSAQPSTARSRRLRMRLRKSALAPLYRLAVRIPAYWTDPKAWYGIVSPWRYLRTIVTPAAFRAQGFSISSLIAKDRLNVVRQATARVVEQEPAE
jgi:asparagine synthase (glutamine-hydrolysing)